MIESVCAAHDPFWVSGTHRFWIVFLLMTVYFSVGFPMRGQLAILVGTLISLSLACLMGTAPLDVVGVVGIVWKLGAVVTVFIMASFPAAELRRQTAEHQRARRRADALSSALARREEWWRSLIDRTSDPIMVFDAHWRITFASPAFEAVMGYSTEEAAAMDLGSMVHPDDLELVRGASSSARPGIPSRMTARLQDSDGAWHDVEISVAKVLGGTHGAHGVARPLPVDTADTAFIVNLRDVTERVTAQAAMSHQATHDALTGLANRTALHGALCTSLANAAVGTRSVTVLVLDLENFKRVNDAAGHAAGDALLVEVGRRLCATLPGADIVARLRDRPHWLRGNVGVACVPGAGSVPDELMQRAGRAMQEAKRTTVGVAVYDRRVDGADVGRFGLLGELRRAGRRGSCASSTSPRCRRATAWWGRRRSCGGSTPGSGSFPRRSSCRWRRTAFLPMAEDGGLVRAVTAWAFPTALKQLSEWVAAGRELSVSVNVSAQDLSDEQFPSLVEEWLEHAHVDPERFVLELTESPAISRLSR